MPYALLRRLAVLIAALAAVPGRASTSHDEQLWINLTVMGPLRGALVHFVELQPRLGSGFGRPDQLILRGAIGVKLSDRATFYQGYARVITPRDTMRDLAEHRSFQQLSWVIGKPFGGEFSTRTRFEQRWRNDGADMGLRLRGMARLEIPVAHSGLAALGYAEGFAALNDTDWGARAGFDQVRSFIGAEIPLAGRSTIELGYLNQTINQRGGRHRMNHMLSFGLFARY